MGKPSKAHLKVAPFCYYCGDDRDFADEQVLIAHQKARHFRCTAEACGKRMATVEALRVHVLNVHKEVLRAVPNAAPGRDWGLHEHTERLLPLLARAGFGDVERLVLERTGHITSILGVGVAGSEGEEVLVPRVAAFLRERMTAS